MRPEKSPGKHPLYGFKWGAVTLADMTDDYLDRCFDGDGPQPGLAIRTGEQSGGLVVFDVDPKHGGVESLDALVAEHGDFTVTTRSHLSGGGGLHVLWHANGTPVPSKVKIRPGLDVRGWGGYIAAPPTLHESGARYEVRDLGLLDVIETVPDWLLPLVNGGSGLGERTGVGFHETADEGERRHTAVSLSGYLRAKGSEPDGGGLRREGVVAQQRDRPGDVQVE